jgi:uncharacterized membrane protein YdjX (TVP38/TMEM64 family)
LSLSKGQQLNNIVQRLALALFGLACVIFLLGLICNFWGPICLWCDRCYNFLGDKQQFKKWLMSFGPLAPLVFISIQSLQVVFAPIPGEATGFIGGFLFGVMPGFFYSTIGLTIGSILAFLLGRWLEVLFVKKVVSEATLKKFDFIIEREGTLIAFLLFLLPGFPKDYLCFILGLSEMPLKVFIILVTIGRLPGTLLLSLQGAQVYKGNYLSFGILLGIFVILGIAMFFYREKIYHWIRKLSGPSAGPETGDREREK